MPTSEPAYNAIATFGRVAIGMHGISSVLIGIMAVVAGGYLLGGSKGDTTLARVSRVECLDDIGRCAVTVRYYADKQLLQSTFTTRNTLGYSRGDATTILVNRENPTMVAEDLPWMDIGVGTLGVAVSLILVGYLALQMVAVRKNVAAVAGGLTFLKLLLF